MKTSSKNFITSSIFWGLGVVWSVSGLVAVGSRHVSVGWNIVALAFWGMSILFVLAGTSASFAEDKAAKK